MTSDAPKEIQIDGLRAKSFAMFRCDRAGTIIGEQLAEIGTIDEVRNHHWRQDWHYCVRVLLDGKYHYLTPVDLEQRVKRSL